MQDYCQAQGLEITGEYVDHAPANDLAHRHRWRDLLDDAARKKFSVVLVFKLDRAFRSVKYMHYTLAAWEMVGPDIQKNNEERFAESHGLVLNNRFYTEFVSGWNGQKRKEFQQILEDAGIDLFDVLPVDHTSRFGRNQGECIRYKDELQSWVKRSYLSPRGSSAAATGIS